MFDEIIGKSINITRMATPMKSEALKRTETLERKNLETSLTCFYILKFVFCIMTDGQCKLHTGCSLV